MRSIQNIVRTLLDVDMYDHDDEPCNVEACHTVRAALSTACSRACLISLIALVSRWLSNCIRELLFWYVLVRFVIIMIAHQLTCFGDVCNDCSDDVS